jgi:two-component system, chemotaxis family, protein-glutamate methylesterase/glutaminase
MSPMKRGGGPIRVLVVEDSRTVRERLCEVVVSDPALELIGQCGDGQRAIELCATHRPDVITMDMMLPTLTGLEATEHIMGHQPTPILIVSSSTNRGELFRTYDALAAGAVDVLEKPRGDEPDGDWEARFLSAVKLVARIPVITHPRARLGAMGRVAPAARAPTLPPAPLATAQPCELIAIGASTGGPGAVVEVLRSLPALTIPVLVVVHIGETFGHALAEWLSTTTGRRVVHADDGVPLTRYAGCIAMAQPGRHLVLRGGQLRLNRDAERHSCRPSIDVLFDSLAAEMGARTAACLLTGMGKDGATGLLAIRRAGGVTIAQDKATSVVYGMPREAAVLGAAQHVLPLPEIGPALARVLVPDRSTP